MGRVAELGSFANNDTTMPVTAEEEVVLLYALYMCGRRPSKGRATQYILTNHLLKEREGDYDTVSTDESKIENRIAWTRQNLKDKGQLSMPDRGTWAITEKGVRRLETVSIRSLSWQDPDPEDEFGFLLGLSWDRFSQEFLSRLRSLGRELQDRSKTKGEQDGPANGSQPIRSG